MNKVISTFALLVTLTTSAAADPLSDFFGGVFGGQSQPQQTVKTKRGKHAHTEPTSNVDYWSNPITNAYHAGQRMVASFYGHGERLAKHTASGAVFNPHALTAAHKTLPFGTHLRVCHRGCATVVVNDRGPFVRGRSLDLSYGAARAIGMGSTSAITVQRLN